MATLIEQFKNLTRYWWALLILGIAIVVVGVMIFVNPAGSYLGMTLAFGIIILVSGIMQLAMSITEKYLPGRGWLIAGAVIEIILGIILLCNPALSAVTLPFFLAFWLLFRGFNLIGFASDMRALKVSGMGWTIAAAILLIICAILILFSPMIIGTAAVVTLVGIGFLLAGISVIVFSFQLLSIKNRYKNMFQ